MGEAHVGLVHCNPCECMVKGFRAVSSIERNVSKRRHLQRVRQLHHGCLSGDHGCPGVVKLAMGLHRGSAMVVKLEVGLHQGGYIREHEVSRGGGASDGASPPKV